MSQKSKTKHKPPQRMWKEEKCLLQEAAERYADTSWKIHHDWYSAKKKSVPSNIKISDQNLHTNNNVETNVYAHFGGIKNGGTINRDIARAVSNSPKQLRKIIEIQTVQTTCENVPPTVITQAKQRTINRNQDAVQDKDL